jgi:hypothetical protein
VAFLGLEPGSLQQMARDHALHHLQHRRDQLGLRGQVPGISSFQPLAGNKRKLVTRWCPHTEVGTRR